MASTVPATVNAVNPGYKAYNRLVDSNFAGPDGGKFVDEYPVETVPLSGDVDKAKEYLAAAMEELGYSDVSQLPQLELITWDTSEQKLLLETIIDQWKQNLGLENIQLTQYVIGTAIGSFYDLSYDLFAITWETDVLPTDIMRPWSLAARSITASGAMPSLTPWWSRPSTSWSPTSRRSSPPRPSRSSWTMRPSCPCMKTA